MNVVEDNALLHRIEPSDKKAESSFHISEVQAFCALVTSVEGHGVCLAITGSTSHHESLLSSSDSRGGSYKAVLLCLSAAGDPVIPPLAKGMWPRMATAER